MRWKFWGVRGSIPTPEYDRLKYGGNTSCYQLILDDKKEAFIFDAGTGIRRLGTQLLKEGIKDYHIFISHIHWDHIQGLPFFAPLYIEDNNVFFYGALKVDARLKDSLRGQMDSFYFPVKLDELKANMIFMEVIEETLFISGLKITVRYQHHPGGSLGFRIEYGDKKIAYCTDSELPQKDVIPEGLKVLAEGVDLLVMDAMYSEEDYVKNKVGWGHASFERVAYLAKKLGVKELCFTHHDPEVSDKQLEKRLRKGREIFPNIFLAREGEEYNLGKVNLDKEEIDLNRINQMAKNESQKCDFEFSKGGILYITIPPLDELGEESFELPSLDFEDIIGVCLDLSKLESLDSLKLGKFVNMVQKFLEKKIICVATGINDYLDHLLRITNVYKYVVKMKSRNAAKEFILNYQKNNSGVRK